MRLYKRWHRPVTKQFIKPPLLHIESSLDRLWLLSPTHDQRSQQKFGQLRSNQFDQQFQVSQGHTSYKNKENWNTEVHGGGGLELVKPARDNQHPAV